MNDDVPPLSPRLAAIAREIASGSHVADIGTDHGRLPLWLAAEGLAASCLATEKDQALLGRVARPALSAPWAARVRYRAGDGLAAVLPEDGVDTVILAGLGGRTIVRLLGAPAAGRLALTRLVLQPRSEAALVRRYLSENGWRPVSESLTVERGRTHVTIAAGRGDDRGLYGDPMVTREDLMVAGPLLARSNDPEVARWWRSERTRLLAIVSRADAGNANTRARAGLARAGRILAAISTRGG